MPARAFATGRLVALGSAHGIASAFQFCRTDAKTDDHYFTGFPSYWNIVAVYLLVADVPATITAIVLVALSVLVFVPIRYVYPSRTPTLRGVTLIGCAIWSVQVGLMIWWLPAVPAWLFWTSLIFPVYYTGLSFWLSAKRKDSRM